MVEKIQTEKIINQIAFKLGDFLADTFVLYIKTLNYHWNMTGTNFFMFHKLLEAQYQELSKPQMRSPKGYECWEDKLLQQWPLF